MHASSITERIKMKSELVLKRRILSRPVSKADSLRSNSQSSRNLRDSQSKFSKQFKTKFERLIQESKVEQILYTEKNKKSSLFENDFASEVREESKKVKKEFNNLVIKRKEKELQANRMKQQIRLLNLKKQKLHSDMTRSRTDMGSAKVVTADTKTTLQQKRWMLKSYESIKRRAQQDMIILQARYKQLESYINYYHDYLKNMQGEQLNLNQTNKKLHQMINKAKQITLNEQRDKNALMTTYCEEVAEKRGIDKIFTERDKKKEQLKQLATSEQEREQLMRYSQLYVVHRVLASVLQTKSKKLLQDHHEEQEAFRYIKKFTNLSDVNKILEKMETQDKVYENLLETVNKLEEDIKNQEHVLRDQLQSRTLLYQKQSHPLKLPKGYYHGIEKDELARLKQLKAEKQAQFKQMQILQESLQKWISKHLEIMNVHSANKEQNIKDLFEVLVSSVK